MIIKTANFIASSAKYTQCPVTDQPEFAFIGRSNVGKSSLINMLSNRKNLARISSTPGKTSLINHFLMNDSWYLVDLPGYGYASVSKKERAKWRQMIHQYLLNRDNLFCTFILLDARHRPQASDIDFINWLGGAGLPLALVLTKMDKVKKNQLHVPEKNVVEALSATWEEMPSLLTSSAVLRKGNEEILKFIEQAISADGND